MSRFKNNAPWGFLHGVHRVDLKVFIACRMRYRCHFEWVFPKRFQLNILNSLDLRHFGYFEPVAHM